MEYTVKILILNGSPRENGNTKKMIAAFKEGAAKHPLPFEVILSLFSLTVNENVLLKNYQTALDPPTAVKRCF